MLVRYVRIISLLVLNIFFEDLLIICSLSLLSALTVFYIIHNSHTTDQIPMGIVIVLLFYLWVLYNNLCNMEHIKRFYRQLAFLFFNNAILILAVL